MILSQSLMYSVVCSPLWVSSIWNKGLRQLFWMVMSTLNEPWLFYMYLEGFPFLHHVELGEVFVFVLELEGLVFLVELQEVDARLDLQFQQLYIFIIYKVKVDFHFKLIFIKIYESFYKIWPPTIKIWNFLNYDKNIFKFIIKYNFCL